MDNNSLEQKPFTSNIPNSAQTIDDPILPALNKRKIDAERLADKLDKELEATEQRVFNNKGDVIYSDDLITWKTRQEARKDAHKLRGDYPAEKRELSGGLTLERVVKELEGEEDQ